MGYRCRDNYDKLNYPQSVAGAFCEGLFIGTFGFLSAIGGWLVSLFCYLHIETSTSWTIAFSMSIGVGLWLGITLAQECRQDKRNQQRRKL